MRARAAAAAFLALAAAPAAQAGPWAMGRGHFYMKAGYDRLRSTTLSTPDGTEFEIPDFRRDILSVYGAFGLSDRITLVAEAPLWRSSDLADDPDELSRESGPGDVQAGLQLQLGTRGAWTFAGRGMVQAPTGDETRAQGLLPTGSGVWEGYLALGAGWSFAAGKGWGFVEAGPAIPGRRPARRLRVRRPARVPPGAARAPGRQRPRPGTLEPRRARGGHRLVRRGRATG